jgi:uncharacterized protein with von Willebrand factor type A (vWA) domain
MPEGASGLAFDTLPALRQVTGFMATLRDNGFRVGLAESADAAHIVASPLGHSPSLLRQALKALCSSTLSDWQAFDRLFDAFFLGAGIKTITRLNGPGNAANKAQRRLGEGGAPRQGDEPDTVEPQRSEGGDNPADGRGALREASVAESIARKDLRRIVDPLEMQKAVALAERLAKSMRARLTRRDRITHRGRRLDVRRTIHKAVPHGGEPIALAFRRRRHKPLKLVVLLDASGSMELYTPFFVRFMHGVVDAFAEAETFIFHTRLVHISAALRDRDATRAIDRMSLMAQGIGGGTKIGESLADFNTWHAKRVIHSRTCVLIMSDGYDTGAAGVLAREMKRLRRRCRRIVWLNPMIAWEGYAPSARGMSEALPYVDLFAPAHSIESLASLEPYLARI